MDTSRPKSVGNVEPVNQSTVPKVLPDNLLIRPDLRDLHPDQINQTTGEPYPLNKILWINSRKTALMNTRPNRKPLTIIGEYCFRCINDLGVADTAHGKVPDNLDRSGSHRELMRFVRMWMGGDDTCKGWEFYGYRQVLNAGWPGDENWEVFLLQKEVKKALQKEERNKAKERKA